MLKAGRALFIDTIVLGGESHTARHRKLRLSRVRIHRLKPYCYRIKYLIFIAAFGKVVTWLWVEINGFQKWVDQNGRPANVAHDV
jgi:hypothetical protein